MSKQNSNRRKQYLEDIVLKVLIGGLSLSLITSIFALFILTYGGNDSQSMLDGVLRIVGI